MRVLLDENIPAPALVSRRVLVPHVFDHVNDVGWAGVTDPDLFSRAARSGFGAIVALDRNQLYSDAEWRALKRSALHHVSIRQTRATQGARGSLRLMASLLLAMPRVLDDLETRSLGCVVEIRLLEDRDRHFIWTYREHEGRNHGSRSG